MQKEHRTKEYARGIRKRNTQEEYAMDNQPNAPKEDEQSDSRPVNKYIRTPTAPTTTQATSSVPG
eukprot:9164604-Ditylum_brightwellii.AAC.1